MFKKMVRTAFQKLDHIFTILDNIYKSLGEISASDVTFLCDMVGSISSRIPTMIPLFQFQNITSIAWIGSRGVLRLKSWAEEKLHHGIIAPV